MIYLKALKEAYIEGIVDNYYTDQKKIKILDATMKACVLPEFVESLDKNQLQDEEKQLFKLRFILLRSRIKIIECESLRESVIHRILPLTKQCENRQDEIGTHQEQ